MQDLEHRRALVHEVLDKVDGFVGGDGALEG